MDSHIEKALEVAEFGKFNYFLILMCGLMISNTFLETMSISFVLPVSDCDLDLSTAKKGIIGAMALWGVMASSHLIGYLADTLGRRAIIRPFLLAGFIATFLSSFANSFWLFGLLRFINGFCVSVGLGATYTYLSEFHFGNKRGQAILLAAFISGATGIFLPLIGMVTLNAHWAFDIPLINLTFRPWRLFLIICGLFGLISGLSLYFIPESPKYLTSVGRNDEALEVLKKIFSWNTGKSKNEYTILSLKEDTDVHIKTVTKKTSKILSVLHDVWEQTVPLVGKKYVRTTTLICCLQFWINTTAFGLYIWLPHIINIVLGESKPGVRFYICNQIDMYTKPVNEDPCDKDLDNRTFYHVLVLEITYAIAYLLIYFLIGRIPKVHMLAAFAAFCGICGCLTVVVNIPTVALYLVMGLLLSEVAATILNAMTVEFYPTNLRAMASSISTMIGRLGSTFGSNFIGALLEDHCETMFIFLGISIIVSGLLGYCLPRTKNILPE